MCDYTLLQGKNLEDIRVASYPKILEILGSLEGWRIPGRNQKSLRFLVAPSRPKISEILGSLAFAGDPKIPEILGSLEGPQAI